MADQLWTVKRILDWTRGYLERKGDEHPRLSAEWLISDACGLTRMEIYLNFDRPLTADELARMHEGVERRAAGEPLQYVTGEMPFRHIVLRCEKGVLIPRPETEVLVDVALEALDHQAKHTDSGSGSSSLVVPRDPTASDDASHANVLAAKGAAAECLLSDGSSSAASPEPMPRDPTASDDASHANVLATKVAAAECLLSDGSSSAASPEPVAEGNVPSLESKALRVLDLCTGTGCIALSLAQERPGTVVVATDLSPVAVALAERNARTLGLEGWVDVLECDLAAGVVPEFEGSFDLLVSNPPYIPSEVLAEQVPAEVRDFEPRLALDGGEDGLDLFRRILELAPRMLRPGGALAVELFEQSLDEAAELVRAQGGWSHVEVREDLTHRPRILLAVRDNACATEA